MFTHTKHNIGDAIYIVAYDDKGRAFALPCTVLGFTHRVFGGKEPCNIIEYDLNDDLRGGITDGRENEVYSTKAECTAECDKLNKRELAHL